jgi:hypothetical protein
MKKQHLEHHVKKTKKSVVKIPILEPKFVFVCIWHTNCQLFLKRHCEYVQWGDLCDNFCFGIFGHFKTRLECLQIKGGYEHGSQNTTPGLNDKKSSLLGNEKVFILAVTSNLRTTNRDQCHYKICTLRGNSCALDIKLITLT